VGKVKKIKSTAIDLTQCQSELVDLLRANRLDRDHDFKVQYHRTPHTYYGWSVPQKRELVRKWLRDHHHLSYEDWEAWLTILYLGESYEEKTLAGHFLSASPTFRRQVPLSVVEKWLSQLQGWAEVDTTCQASFTAEEMLANWDEWKAKLWQWTVSKNVWLQRAGLVLLVKPLMSSDDIRLWKQAEKEVDDSFL
jgi:3-methyladenine DNA glycosylase AlkD